MLPSGMAGSRCSGDAAGIFCLLHGAVKQDSPEKPALGDENRPSLKQDGTASPSWTRGPSLPWKQRTGNISSSENVTTSEQLESPVSPSSKAPDYLESGPPIMVPVFRAVGGAD